MFNLCYLVARPLQVWIQCCVYFAKYSHEINVFSKGNVQYLLSIWYHQLSALFNFLPCPAMYSVSTTFTSQCMTLESRQLSSTACVTWRVLLLVLIGVICGVKGEQATLQYFFYLKMVFFGCLVEQCQIKKQKYFLNDYFGGVKTEKTISLHFTGYRIEAAHYPWSILPHFLPFPPSVLSQACACSDLFVPWNWILY